MNPNINYSQYNISDIGIAQQTNLQIEYTHIQNCTNISDFINLYHEYWYLIIGDYDIVIITVCIMEIMIILMIKDLYHRYRKS